MTAPDTHRFDTARIRHLGRQPYTPVWQEMQAFTEQRRQHRCADELWFVEHDPVFTQGTNGRAEHVLVAGDIPVVQTDRGGQVTYHGPGQVTAYVLADLSNLNMGVRSLVTALENAMVATLAGYRIQAHPRRDAPGVYVDDAKIGSIGLRVRHGLSYHGIALNVDMDLAPFSRINPCGYKGLRMTQIRDLVSGVDCQQVIAQLQCEICRALGLTESAPVQTRF